MHSSLTSLSLCKSSFLFPFHLWMELSPSPWQVPQPTTFWTYKSQAGTLSTSSPLPGRWRYPYWNSSVKMGKNLKKKKNAKSWESLKGVFLWRKICNFDSKKFFLGTNIPLSDQAHPPTDLSFFFCKKNIYWFCPVIMCLYIGWQHPVPLTVNLIFGTAQWK